MAFHFEFHSLPSRFLGFSTAVESLKNVSPFPFLASSPVSSSYFPNHAFRKNLKRIKLLRIECNAHGAGEGEADQLIHNPACMGSVSSVAQLCPTHCNPMNRSTPGLPVHHQLPEFTQTHVHRVSDAIQPSHPLLLPLQSLPASGSFLTSRLFASGGQSTGVSASASVLPMSILD